MIFRIMKKTGGNVCRFCALMLVFALLLSLPALCAEPPRIFCIIPYYPSIDFWTDIEASMDAAAEECGAELVKLYTRHTEPNLELGLDEALRIAMFAGADAVITSYTLADEETDDLLAALREQGIPAVMIDCDCPEELRAAYIGIDNESAGYEIGSLARGTLDGGKHTLLVYSGTTLERENLQERIAGLRRAFEDDGAALAEYTAGGFTVSAVLALRQAIEADPAIASLIAVNENTTVLCAQALAGSSRSGEVRLFGFDESEETLALLEAGVMDALGCQTHSEMGRLSVETAAALAAGKTEAAGTRLVECVIREREPS